MAIMAMTSLIIGALIGVYVKPSQRTNAVIMAFGTGALIQALALELAYEGAERLIHVAHLGGIASWLWVAAGFIAGGTVYYAANRFLEQRGSALRHPALSKLYMLNKKREESAEILEKLAKIELVRSLPPEEMEDVLMCVQPVEVQSGSFIFKQGEDGDALYFIDSGRVEIVSGDSTAGRKTLAELGAGQSFGEMALLTGEPRSASAVAAGPTSLLRIDKVHFDELIDRSPNLRSSVQELISVRLLQNVQTAKSSVDAGHWQKVALANIQRLSRSEEVSMMKEHAATGAPFAIFLGAMLDGIPESIVIGSSFVSFETFKFTFFAAVFLSNLPEAVASATAMRSAGFSTMKILGLWGSLMVTGGIAAVLGNIFLTTAPPTILTLVGAVAGGGILAMVSSVMMPEAYEDGGPSVGLATIAGFLCAFLFSLL
ncbi:MAG: cyclic nucleotide-binding domain-containing protein [Bacteroidota bacterium]